MSVRKQKCKNSFSQKHRLSKGTAVLLTMVLCFGASPAWAVDIGPYVEVGTKTNQIDNSSSGEKELQNEIKVQDDGATQTDDDYVADTDNTIIGDIIHEDKGIETSGVAFTAEGSDEIVALDEGDPDYSGTVAGTLSSDPSINYSFNWKYYTATGTLVLDGEYVQFQWSKSKLGAAFYGAVKKADVKNLEFSDNVKYIANSASLPSVTSLHIPETVTELGDGAFYDFTSLQSVDLPSTLTTIPEGLFEACENLTEVDLPEGITSIGQGAFTDCTALTSTGIEKCTSLSSLGGVAFSNCTSLKSIDLSNTALKSLPGSDTVNGAFMGCGVTDLKLPKGLETLNSYALNQCGYLTNVVVPSSVTSLEKGSFQLVGWNAFQDDGTETTVILPYGIQTIDENAFPGDPSSWTNLVVCGAPTAESTKTAVESVKGKFKSVKYQMHHDASTDPYEVTSQDSEISFTCDTCGDEVVYTVNDYAPIAIDGQEAQAFKTAVGASGSLLTGYKVSLKDTDDNAVTTLDNKLKITLPISDAKVGESLQIYHMNDDGTTALLGAVPVTEAGFATFETDTAGGTFAVVRTTELTLTFDTVGGTSVDAESVTYNATPSKPATDPTRDGYTFTGWFSDAACTTEFDFTQPLTANATIYAGWSAVKAETVSLTFDVQGGSAEAVQTLDSGTTPTKPADPTRDGYAFTGWFSDAACTTAFDFTQPLTANTTVYAGWKANDVSDDNTGNTNVGTPNSTTGNPTGVAAKSSSSTSPVASASTIAKTGDDLIPLGVLLASTSLMAALAAGAALRRKQKLS